jgi:predicted metal-dependent HD superfamily phosphohydrolase
MRRLSCSAKASSTEIRPLALKVEMDPASLDRLARQWTTAAGAFGAGTDAVRDSFSELVARHGEPHRHYHTSDHVVAVLNVLATFGTSDSALFLAACYHDAVYDTRSVDNEERSAALARVALVPLHVPGQTIEETARLILLTKSHQTADSDAVGRQLLDADLSILASDTGSYDRYAAAIRLAYAWVPDEAYRVGRRRVLEGFLARPRLFFFLPDAEVPARANMQREIVALA